MAAAFTLAAQQLRGEVTEAARKLQLGNVEPDDRFGELKPGTSLHVLGLDHLQPQVDTRLEPRELGLVAPFGCRYPGPCFQNGLTRSPNLGDGCLDLAPDLFVQSLLPDRRGSRISCRGLARRQFFK
jgi:hypothetical protein